MTGKTDVTDNFTIGGLIRKQAEIRPDHQAIVTRTGEEYTYGDFNRITIQVAKSLLALNTPPRTHVAIWAMNSPAWIFAMGGSARIGLPFIGLNTGYRAEELQYVLNHSDAGILFIGEGAGRTDNFSDIFAEVSPDGIQCSPSAFMSARLPALRHVISLGSSPYQGILSWDEFIASGDAIPDTILTCNEEKVQPDDLAMIIYTSGTTGIPKGVMHTYHDLILNLSELSGRLYLTEKDIACIPPPLFHILGIAVPFLSFITGGSIALIERFSGREFLATIEACQATVVYGVVTMFVTALEEMKYRSFKTSSLRCGIISGSRCPPELCEQIIERMGVSGLVILYGSTELICLTTSRSDDSRKHRIETVGFPMDGSEILICDPGTGKTLPVGEIGEAWVRCPWMVKGYYKMPEETARAVNTYGFYRTRDLLSADTDGYYRFCGRADEMIIRGGENVYAIEIEEPLRLHPAVMDVRVIGIPCRFYGEDIVAFVIPRPGTAVTPHTIKNYLRRTIAIHKVPSVVIFTDQFPMTGSGKVRLSSLRDMAVKNRDGRFETNIGEQRS